MKKIFYALVLILMTCLLLTGTGAVSAEPDAPRIILYTYYRQMGWGDRVQIGWVDEDGGFRLLTGHDSRLEWPYKPAEQLEYLSQAEKFDAEDTLRHDDIFSIQSLVCNVEDRGSRSIPAANDAGTEKSYAVRYSKDGEPEFILLGMSGDDFFENLDPNAQALYLLLRRLFPAVTSYAYGPIGPQGFAPVPFAAFTGLDPDALMNADVKAVLMDCEAGPIPLEITAESKAALLSLIRNGRVTGRADCVVSTGGMTEYSFFDEDDNWIGSVEFEDGLLVWDAGHYYVER